MILVDTGPFVALFDPKDDEHTRAAGILASLREPLITTVPVLTEAFHLLGPASRGSAALRLFVGKGGVQTWFLARSSLARAFELMKRYDDHPMDLADASLVTAAEELRTTTIFTIDRNDFATYRARIGRSSRAFRVLA
ncbi:MAG: PIN domain-containing protein [Deltaproteobacteria bacterium]|nr:PIN domain-containing protein [Deltaproteobacteria bacterium]